MDGLWHCFTHINPITLLGGSSHLVGYKPTCKRIHPTCPTSNQGYNILTKWDEPPSNISHPLNGPQLCEISLLNHGF